MTARQFYIMLFIIVVSLKVQKLPSLIAESLEKDTYLLIILYLIINLLLICLAFFILKNTKQSSLKNNSKSVVLNLLKKLLLIGISAYFIFQSLLFYESIQNLFAHVLFYELPWTLFSLMLTVCVFYLAYTGIKNIALNFELYAFMVLASYVIISIFGGTKADFKSILPFESVNIKQIGEIFLDFNMWFGDFFLVLFMGKHAKHIKLKWTALVYSVSMLFVALLYIEFFGIYQDYTPMKPSLISVLSEQSMLGVNIGRIDWFFILFTEIGTILSAGVCLYFANKSLSFAFPKIKKTYLLIVLTAAIYFIDIFYLVDIHTQKELFIDILSNVALIIKLLSFLCLLIYAISKQKHNKKQQNTLQKQMKLKPAKNNILFDNAKNLGGEKWER